MIVFYLQTVSGLVFLFVEEVIYAVISVSQVIIDDCSQTYLSICVNTCHLVKQKLVFWQNIGKINAYDQECCKHIISGRKSIGITVYRFRSFISFAGLGDYF